MSERRASPLTLSVYNPSSLKKEDLIRGFVARQALLERLVEDLRREGQGGAPQHQLLIGQRGLGKTTLLQRLAYAVEDDEALSAAWIPLVFPEEQYNVGNLGDFWLNCADALSDAIDRRGDAKASEALDAKVERVAAGEQRAVEALETLVEESNRLGRRLLLLVDNIDVILDRLSREQEWEFRRVLSQERRIHIVGASSRFLEAVYEHGRAFYDFFQVQELKGLDDAEMFSVLDSLARELGNAEVQELLQTRKARLQALHRLTGGNPRTVVLLYRVLADAPDGDVQRDVEQLLDLYTPLYKARFEDLPAQAQQVVDAMAIHWDPVTAAELSELLRPLPVSQVSAQLKRLEDFGVVEKTPWFGEKKAAYQIAERFFNIWYLMRASRRVRRRLIWLVKFLEAWFDQEELTERAIGILKRGPEAIGGERFAEMAVAYAQAVADKTLRRRLHFSGVKALVEGRIGVDLFSETLSADELDRAEKALRGLTAEPEFEAEAWGQLGWLLSTRLQRHAECEEAFRKAIALDGDEGEFWVGLGLAYIGLERFDEAERAFRRVIELDPQIRAGWLGLCVVLCNTFRLREGCEAMAHFLKADFPHGLPEKTSEAVLQAAELAMFFPDALPAALELLRKANRLLPNHLRTRSVLATALVLAGEWENGKALFEELVGGESDSVSVRLLEAIVETGHLEEAIEMFERKGAQERWRPAYEALKAAQAGTPDYLRRVAPEVREVTMEILRVIAPPLFPEAEA